MTAGKESLLQSRGSARQFLFSKTDTGRLKEISRLKPGDADQVLQNAYPNLLWDAHFIDHALQDLQSAAQFAAMVVRLDSPEPERENLAASEAVDRQAEVVKILESVCRQEKAMCGGFESGLLGVFLPDKSGPQALELARNAQKRLQDNTRQTITVGIAAYPTIGYQKSEILDNARKALDHATFFGPNSAVIFDSVSLNISGDALYEQADIRGAIAEFKKALELNPSNVNVHNSLGVCFGLQGDYDKAIEEFKAAVLLEPEEYMALYNLGLVHMLTQQFDKALELFLKADKINGDAYEVSFQTGKLYLELGEPAKGRSFLERAAALEPNSGAVHRCLGDCYAADNLHQEAISAYRKAIKLNPQDAASMSALGCLFEAQGENPEITLMFCRESVGLAPENGLFRYRLGRLYSKQRRFEDALREFKMAQQLGYDASEDIKEIEKNHPEHT
ncbi:MAG: tetratricopeptide repeat protein [Desulfobacterales bacterium]|nr:MAG: tetratricopeptide repeat protein [Desulfobacterales bacterium]